MSLVTDSESPLDCKVLLRSYIAERLPVLGLLGAQIVEASVSEVLVGAPLSRNLNDKGTVFGGSQYCLGIASAWALGYLNAQLAGVSEPDLVGMEGTIKYLQPSDTEQVYARACADQQAMTAFREAVTAGERARLVQFAQLESPCVAGRTHRVVVSEFQIQFVLANPPDISG